MTQGGNGMAQTNRVEIHCIGNATLDLFIAEGAETQLDIGNVTLLDSAALHAGGTAANTAMALATLGFGAVLHTRLGDDLAGELLMTRLESAGVRVVAARGKATNTTLTIYIAETKGGSRFAYHPGTSADFAVSDVDDELLQTAQFVHVGGTFLLPAFDGQPCARMLAASQQEGITTSLDPTPNITPDSLGLLAPCLPYLDYFIPNLDQARQLSGLVEPEDASAFFRDRGAGAVVVKMAEQGCYVQTADASFAVPAFRVTAVEHTGAGDAFVAGFLAGLSQSGMDLHHCIRLANAVGAMCVSSVGAADGIGTFAETLDFMEQSHA